MTASAGARPSAVWLSKNHATFLCLGWLSVALPPTGTSCAILSHYIISVSMVETYEHVAFHTCVHGQCLCHHMYGGPPLSKRGDP